MSSENVIAIQTLEFVEPSLPTYHACISVLGVMCPGIIMIAQLEGYICSDQHPSGWFYEDCSCCSGSTCISDGKRERKGKRGSEGKRGREGRTEGVKEIRGMNKRYKKEKEHKCKNPHLVLFPIKCTCCYFPSATIMTILPLHLPTSPMSSPSFQMPIETKAIITLNTKFSSMVEELCFHM